MESILPGGNEDRCYLIGDGCPCKGGKNRHHVFFGHANRRLSEKDGCWVYLCVEHHTGNGGVHQNRDKDLALKMKAQAAWEERYGTREEFRKRYGKSYL